MLGSVQVTSGASGRHGRRARLRESQTLQAWRSPGTAHPHLSTAVAAATPNFRHLEWFHDHVRIENLFFEGTLDPDGGWLRPETEPGNGLTLRNADAARYRVR
jgi:L-alanine-DL-glutamate epimerase-like enolase superfamily enzyme